MRRSATLAAMLGLGLAALSACTNDFGKFDLTGDAGVATGGTGNSGTGGLGATGGTSATGGSAAAGAAGTHAGGGAGTSAGGSSAGAAGSAGNGGGNGGGGNGGGGSGGVGCTPIQKLCAGVCVSLDSPQTGCEASDPVTGAPICTPCVVAHATAACGLDGACAVGTCASGWGDCNTRADDGCEHQTLTDTANCGACNRSCNSTGVASVECSGGTCSSTCMLGRANCTQPATGADDGCETTVSNVRTRCGSCTNDCSRQNLGACANSLCTCTARNNCGTGGTVACDTATGLCSCNGTACVHGETCNQNACSCNGGSACSAGQVCCQTPAGCHDLSTDTANCGACGRACTPGFSCSAGQCACTRNSDCGGVDTATGGAGGAPATGGSAGTPAGGAGGGGSGAAGSPAAGGTGGIPSTGFYCVSGRCVCNGATACAEGQRCTANGSCG